MKEAEHSLGTKFGILNTIFYAWTIDAINYFTLLIYSGGYIPLYNGKIFFHQTRSNFPYYIYDFYNFGQRVETVFRTMWVNLSLLEHDFWQI